MITTLIVFVTILWVLDMFFLTLRWRDDVCGFNRDNKKSPDDQDLEEGDNRI